MPWALVILAAISLTGCVHRGVTVEEVDAMVRAQVPIGSDRDTVNSFIDNLTIHRRGLENAALHLKYASTARDRRKLEELDGRIAEDAGAVISDAETGFLHYCAIVIRFYVDKDGKLIDYTVTKEETE